MLSNDGRTTTGNRNAASSRSCTVVPPMTVVDAGIVEVVPPVTIKLLSMTVVPLITKADPPITPVLAPLTVVLPP